MPKVIEAIQTFIAARRPTHNAPELLDRLNPFMEMQINQAADKARRWMASGEPSRWRVYLVEHPRTQERQWGTGVQGLRTPLAPGTSY